MITKNDQFWIVELEPNVWLASWSGDPGRTCDPNNAQSYITENSAKRALEDARCYAPFTDARILSRPYTLPTFIEKI